MISSDIVIPKNLEAYASRFFWYYFKVFFYVVFCWL